MARVVIVPQNVEEALSLSAVVPKKIEQHVAYAEADYESLN